ncbi:gliding motility-associated C-terminal domain-containing protein [Mucilaginibacter xinganensis]|nr:gliding motility-associated C-terminal domain-containing protein [Mucilaginibacter xinganensis]
MAFALQGLAQVCTGSLGDPVINQDFGSGTGQGTGLGTGVTNYNFVGNDCPDDGSYTIASHTDGCFANTWHALGTDHTGNPNGYMMIVNASNNPGLFYTQKADAGQLCPNTTYEFAAYIVNLILPSACGGASTRPNITFSIETTTGEVLKTYNTGDIVPTDDVKWKQYGTFFTTPANVTSVIVKMINNAPGGCGNDLALDDITFRACGPLIQSGFGTSTGQPSQELCEGQTATYTLKASVTGNNPVLQWQVNTNGSGWTDIGGANTNAYFPSFNNAIKGVYQYRLGVSNGSDISSVNCRVYSPPLTVNVIPLPVVRPIDPQIFCEGNQLTLTATGGVTYVWSGPNLASTTQNPLVINNVTRANEGIYTVVATSDRGCSAAPVHVQVKIAPKIVAGISNNIAVCAGEGTQLSASGGLYYKWTPSTGLDHDDIPNPVARPLETTTYNVDVSNDGCNDDSKTVTVTVRQNPVADGGGNKNIFQGQSVKLNGIIKGDEITNVYWTPATALDNPNLLTPTASPADDITYTLHIVSQNCGTVSSNVFVRVYKKITVPNAFSPNNDGVNDTWNIEALITYPESSIMVFNRYGQKVYQSTGYAKAWDGKYNGAVLPGGTYYYIIDLKNNTPKRSGWVYILR